MSAAGHEIAFTMSWQNSASRERPAFVSGARRFRAGKALSLLSGLLLAAGPASATTMIYSGQDDGVYPGQAISSSSAAEQAFLSAASAFGAVLTEDFETVETGHYSPLELTGLSISYETLDFGPGFSGVSDIDYGTPHYGFNVTDDGEKWFGFPDFVDSHADFTFAETTHAFGFFMTGLQSDQTSSLTLHLLDGSLETFSLPINSNGGVSFFGITDTIGFTAVTLKQENVLGYADAWGIDDISFNSSLGEVIEPPAAVPEPAAWALLIGGFGMVGLAQRQRRRRISRLS